MGKKIFVKPSAPGNRVRNPLTGAFLPEDGAWVNDCSYWRRRKNEGGVVESKPPKMKKEDSK